MPLEKRRNALPGGQILLNNNNEGEQQMEMEIESAEKELLLLDCPRSDEEFPSSAAGSSNNDAENHTNANASSSSNSSSSSFPISFPSNPIIPESNELMAILIGQIQEQMNLLSALPNNFTPQNSSPISTTNSANTIHHQHSNLSIIPGIDGPSYPLFPSFSAPNLHHLPIRQAQNCCSSSTMFHNQFEPKNIDATIGDPSNFSTPINHQKLNQFQLNKFVCNSIDEKAICEALLTSPQALAISGLLPPATLSNAQLWDQWLCQLATTLSATQWQQFWRHYAALFGLQSLPSHLNAFFHNSSLNKYSNLGAFSFSPFKNSNNLKLNQSNDDYFLPNNNHRLRRSEICDLGLHNSELNIRIRDIFYGGNCVVKWALGQMDWGKRANGKCVWDNKLERNKTQQNTIGLVPILNTSEVLTSPKERVINLILLNTPKSIGNVHSIINDWREFTS